MKTFSTYSQRHWLMEIGVSDGLHISMHVFIMKHFILAVIRAIKPFCDNIWYRKMQTPWRLPKSIFFYLIEVKYSKCLHIWIYISNSYFLMIASNSHNKYELYLDLESNWKKYSALHFVIQSYVLEIKTWKCQKNLSPGNLLHVKKNESWLFLFSKILKKGILTFFSKLMPNKNHAFQA